MKSLIAASLLLLLATGGRAQVVGGHSVSSDADYYCALVDVNISDVQPFCGAALIAPQWVLTAGHCVVDLITNQPAPAIDVVIHPYYRNAPAGTWSRVASALIIPHPLFDMTSGSVAYDIALIKLAAPVTNASFLQLPAQGHNLLSAPGTVAYVTGFGLSDTADLTFQPDTLQMAEIEVISNDTCNTPDRYNQAVLPGMICAGKIAGAAIGGAAGDSGGPLFVINGNQKVQIGVVSFGDDLYSKATHPGVYTRVATYRQWIDSVINANTTTSVAPLPTATPPVISQAAGSVKISFAQGIASDLTYAIYNVNGQKLVSGEIAKGQAAASIPFTAPVAGLYLLHLSGAGGYHNTAKIISE
ncbi:MAG: serine protease [Sphingobacteriales bacterium]|nr:MAG: serine protease [Sphingobacteriales bacterium]